MPQRYLHAVCQCDQTVNPLFTFLSARLTRAEKGEAEIILPVSSCLRQGGGMVAGGILATIADEAMAHAVLSLLEGGRSAVTAEMNIRYLKGADPAQGGELRAQARVVKKGKTLCVAEASVHDAEKRLLATAGATFFVVKSGKGNNSPAAGLPMPPAP